MTIFGDWGSTRLRLWCGDERSNGPGIVGLTRPPADVLREAIAPWPRPDCIVLCGMAGARGGLHEAGYVECPTSPHDWTAQATRFDFDGIDVRIAAGCATATDVMRGEETQVFGAVALRPELATGSQTIVLPGTHSKWVRFVDGRIEGFRTFPTGELFALLGRSSLLGAGSGGSDADAAEGFAAGIAAARTTPGLLGKLFPARAAQLRQGKSARWAEGYLSGLLIASEAAETQLLPTAITLIGDTALTTRYTDAVGAFGIVTDRLDGDDCVRAGLELLDANAR